MPVKNKNYKAWEINEKNFPQDSEEKLKFLINYAILAPSSHNTQPWLFKIITRKDAEPFDKTQGKLYAEQRGNFHTDSLNQEIHIYADFKRKLTYSDKEGRMLYIALGCALCNICVAADYFEMGYKIEYNEEVNNFKNPALKIIFNQRPIANNKQLFSAITKRHSNRNKYKDKPVPEEYLKEFRNYNKEQDLKINFISDENLKNKIAEISSEAMGKVMSDGNFRKELAFWLRNNLTKKFDGMPGNGHNMSLFISLFAPHILRNINVSRVEAKKERRKIRNLPVIGIISSRENNPLLWIKTGELLEKILFCAASKNIDFVIRVASIEVPEAREKLKQALNIDFMPQILFGLGYAGKEAPLSPRRPLEDFIIS